MATTTPATTEKQATKEIELIAMHEHAGRRYPAGAKLTLPVAEADWLIGIKKAKAADSAASK